MFVLHVSPLKPGSHRQVVPPLTASIHLPLPPHGVPLHSSTSENYVKTGAVPGSKSWGFQDV